MRALESRHLFSLDIDLHPMIELGTTPVGGRRIFPVSGGTFAGERLKGEVSPYAGSDVLLVRSDGSREQDVRLLLLTDDGAQILMTYRGRAHTRPQVPAHGETPAGLYLRTVPFFETASPDYAWLNSIVSVSVGERRSDSLVHYEVFEIL